MHIRSHSHKIPAQFSELGAIFFSTLYINPILGVETGFKVAFCPRGKQNTFTLYAYLLLWRILGL